MGILNEAELKQYVDTHNKIAEMCKDYIKEFIGYGYYEGHSIDPDCPDIINLAHDDSVKGSYSIDHIELPTRYLTADDWREEARKDIAERERIKREEQIAKKAEEDAAKEQKERALLAELSEKYKDE